MAVLWRQACATGMQVQIRKMFPIWQDRILLRSQTFAKAKQKVRSVTEESPDEQDDHFMVYSTHTVDAVKSNGITVPVYIVGTMSDMQLDAAADVSLLPESLYRKHLSHLPLLPADVKMYENQTGTWRGKSR